MTARYVDRPCLREVDLPDGTIIRNKDSRHPATMRVESTHFGFAQVTNVDTGRFTELRFPLTRWEILDEDTYSSSEEDGVEGSRTNGGE